MKFNILKFLRSKLNQTFLILFIISSLSSLKINENKNKNLIENIKEKSETLKNQEQQHLKKNLTGKALNNNNTKQLTANEIQEEYFSKSLTKEDLIRNRKFLESEKKFIDNNFWLKPTDSEYSDSEESKEIEKEAFQENSKEVFNIEGAFLKINLRYITKEEIVVLKK